MKVYIVCYFDFEDWDVEKVFSNLEAAKKYASELAAKDDVYQYEVLEYDVCD